MPNTKITIFDIKSQKVADLGDTGEARNTLYYDPKGKILCAGGFGSLNGNIDFWDLSSDNIVKISSTNAFSSSYHEWCPDGYHFLAGVVAPRMRQDNGIKILNYHGELIYKEDIPELFHVHWRPYPADLFPAGPLIAPNPEATKVPPLAAPKPYRHPNFSGAASTTTPVSAALQPAKSTPMRYSLGHAVRPKPGGTLVGGELDDTPTPEPVKVPLKKPVSGPIITHPVQTPQQSIPQTSNSPTPNIYKPPTHHLPHSPPHSPPQPYRKEKSHPNPQQQPYKKGPQTFNKEKSGGNSGPQSVYSSNNPNNNNISEAEKRRRTLVKKMREIQSLKQKQAAGETLLPAQLAKIASELQVQADLDSLPKNETPEVKTPRS